MEKEIFRIIAAVITGALAIYFGTRKIKGELGDVEVFKYWRKTPVGFLITWSFGLISFVVTITAVINIASL
jgi:hypothetical protein